MKVAIPAWLVAGSLTLASPALLAGLQDPPTTPPSAVESHLAYVKALHEEIARLEKQLREARQELASVRLKHDQAERELAEIRQFLVDHREFGDDFARYREIKAITEREERRRTAEEIRLKREEEAARRLAERAQGKSQRDAERAEEERQENFRKAGFQPLGLETYLGRVGFFYHTERSTGARVEYEPIIGHFLEPVEQSRIDFSKMTISGSVVNTSDEVRNLGVAIAFFDRRGNQIGAATVQINNARPNVPYPFTTVVDMALDGPFARSSSWVLYADPVPPTGP